MSNKLLISLTHGKDDPDRASFAFMVANTALAASQEVVVFLNIDGAYLAVEGYADDVHEPGFKPLKEMIDQFLQDGGKIWVCGTCFKKRNLDQNQLVKGMSIIGSINMIEFLASGAQSLSY